MLKKLIYDSYVEAVKLSDAPKELKDSLRTNERIPAFLGNLEIQLSKVKNLKKESVKIATYEMTKLFLNAVKRKADERMISDAAKTAMIKNQDRIKKIEQAVDTGIITEEILEDA